MHAALRPVLAVAAATLCTVGNMAGVFAGSMLVWERINLDRPSHASIEWGADACIVSARLADTRCFKLSTGEPLPHFSRIAKFHSDADGRSAECTSCCLSPDGRLMALGSSNAIYIWESGGASPVARLEGIRSHVIECRFSRDNAQLVAVSQKATVYSARAPVWNIKSESQGTESPLILAHWDEVSDRVYFRSKSVAFIQRPTGKWQSAEFQTDYSPAAVAFGRHQDAMCVAAASGDTSVNLFRLKDGSLFRQIIDNRWIVRFVRLSEESDDVVTADREAIRITNTRTGATDVVALVMSHRPVEASVSPDGDQVSVVFDDGHIKLFNVR